MTREFPGFRQRVTPALVEAIARAVRKSRAEADGSDWFVEIVGGSWASASSGRLRVRWCAGCCDCIGRDARQIVIERRDAGGGRFAIAVELGPYDDDVDVDDMARRALWDLEMRTQTRRSLATGEGPDRAVLDDDTRLAYNETPIPAGWPPL